jgi:hypothetical protein
LVLLPALSTGCQLFQDLKDVVDDLTQPVLMQVIYVGLEEPDPMDGIDLAGTKLSVGSTINAYIYDANLTTGALPATGAAVTLLSESLRSVGLAEDGKGAYSADGGDGLDYRALDDVEVVADYGGVRRRVGMRTPNPAIVSIPEAHSAGVAISIDLRGQDFDNAVVLVLDLSSEAGGTAWESEIDPTTPKDANNLTQTIPGSVFEDDHLYVVGVVGLKAADDADFEDVQVLGSGMMAGTMVLHPVSTIDLSDTGAW